MAKRNKIIDCFVIISLVIIFSQQFMSLWCSGGVGIKEDNSPKESVIKLRIEGYGWNDDYGSGEHEAIYARQKRIELRVVLFVLASIQAVFFIIILFHYFSSIVYKFLVWWCHSY